jgi:hypothetical protein
MHREGSQGHTRHQEVWIAILVYCRRHYTSLGKEVKGIEPEGRTCHHWPSRGKEAGFVASSGIVLKGNLFGLPLRW